MPRRRCAPITIEPAHVAALHTCRGQGLVKVDAEMGVGRRPRAGQCPHDNECSRGNLTHSGAHHGAQSPSHTVSNHRISNRPGHGKSDASRAVGATTGNGVHDEGGTGTTTTASKDGSEIT